MDAVSKVKEREKYNFYMYEGRTLKMELICKKLCI